ncbi:hypothetical protein CI105_09340 [Candidatus Izimaplasma bacterium ZiA1]|uniref:hypothetical protein n=1 Tax=Candidatus Izimoplasma sp. ZiA1 TaxID=2024899 RepID=UPI000BAA8971|nr:hypothetical protein CI105_09340 [Candidatus Izimaplasma bacterium ZiA1]
MEIKSKAIDKATEQKVQYYTTTGPMDQTWSANNGFVLRLAPGVGGEGTNVAGLSRIGQSVNLKSCTANLRINLNKTADGILQNLGNTVYCRILFVDNLSDNTALAAADVLQDPATPINSTYKNSMSSSKKYKVYADYKFCLSDDKPQKLLNFKMKIPKTGRVVHYDIGSTNPSDLNLSMIWVAEGINPVSFNKPVYNIFMKSRFEDA